MKKENTKIINFIWRIKLQAIKTLIKEQRQKIKKLKVKRSNWNTLYIPMVKLKTNKTSTREKLTKNSNQNSNVWIWNNKKKKDHGAFTSVGEWNEGKKKKITSDILARFGVHVPPIMKKKTTRNNLKWRMTIFYNHNLLHAPPKMCGGSNEATTFK